jgi:hypothetical protein
MTKTTTCGPPKGHDHQCANDGDAGFKNVTTLGFDTSQTAGMIDHKACLDGKDGGDNRGYNGHFQT